MAMRIAEPVIVDGRRIGLIDGHSAIVHAEADRRRSGGIAGRGAGII